jgi:lantibiotic biosynthesis protein
MSESNEVFAETAARIGARIARDAVWAGRRCTWFGATLDLVGGNWAGVERTLGPDLYGGTSGVALFLARLYARTKEEAFRTTAEGALHQTLARIEETPPPVWPSFYSGLTGVAYVLFHSAELLERGEEMTEQALALLQRLRMLEVPTDSSEDPIDLLSGLAGAIPVLLGVHARYPNDGWLDLAVRYGDRVVRAAHRRDGEASWASPGQPETRHLLGLAHGSSGIGCALLELSAATAEPRFRDVGEEAFAYERRLFDPKEENWPDLREAPAEDTSAAPAFMVAWCHGAPGIGLARLRAMQLRQVAHDRSEAEAAVRTSAKAVEQMLGSPYANFSLCHGLGSLGDLLLMAADVLPDPEAFRLARRIGVTGIETLERERLPWPGGVNGGGDTPGLLLGQAGIGYFLLRLADPQEAPSVLLVTPDSIVPSATAVV